MKTKPFIIIITLFAVVGFQNRSNDSLLIKQTTNLKTGSTTSYTYDVQGRILYAQSSKGNKTTYTYSGKIILKETTEAGTNKTSVDTLYLNDKNLVASIRNKNGAVQKFEYDEAGRFIKSEVFFRGEYGGKTIWQWEAGNQLVYTSYNEKEIVQSQILYSYLPNNYNSISEKNRGMSYMGQDSKNLISKSVGVSSIVSANDTSILTYNYKFYDDGSVKLKVSHGKTGNLVDSIAYVYY